MTKGASLRGHHLIIIGRARTINIIIIFSIRRGILSKLAWWWKRKTTKARLVATNATDFGFHLTHLIGQMIQMTTKISMNVLKLLHDVSKGEICSKGGKRSRWGRGSRGRGCIDRLHTRPLRSKLCYTLLNSLLANDTHDMEERRRRNGDVHVCEDMCDSRRKDELITCNTVLIAIHNRYYHVWWKVYGKDFHERKKEMSTRLGDSVMVWLWSESKVITILRIRGPLANLVVEKFREPPHTMAFSRNSETNSSLEIEEKCSSLG